MISMGPGLLEIDSQSAQKYEGLRVDLIGDEYRAG
jgi:hypothetical protein